MAQTYFSIELSWLHLMMCFRLWLGTSGFNCRTAVAPVLFAIGCLTCLVSEMNLIFDTLKLYFMQTYDRLACVNG